jgi:hypothetical protein
LASNALVATHPPFCLRRAIAGIVLASNAFVLQMRKTENFRLGGNLGFCLLVAQPPYPLNRILQCWLRAYGAGFIFFYQTN